MTDIHSVYEEEGEKNPWGKTRRNRMMKQDDEIVVIIIEVTTREITDLFLHLIYHREIKKEVMF